jgi:hypothetical protein
MVGNKNQFGLTVDESCVGGGKNGKRRESAKDGGNGRGEAISAAEKWKTPRRSTSRNGAALN